MGLPADKGVLELHSKYFLTKHSRSWPAFSSCKPTPTQRTLVACQVTRNVLGYTKLTKPRGIETDRKVSGAVLFPDIFPRHRRCHTTLQLTFNYYLPMLWGSLTYNCSDVHLNTKVVISRNDGR